MVQISQPELAKELARIERGVVVSEAEGSTEFLNGWRAGCKSAVETVKEWVLVHLVEQSVEQPRYGYDGSFSLFEDEDIPRWRQLSRYAKNCWLMQIWGHYRKGGVGCWAGYQHFNGYKGYWCRFVGGSFVGDFVDDKFTAVKNVTEAKAWCDHMIAEHEAKRKL